MSTEPAEQPDQGANIPSLPTGDGYGISPLEEALAEPLVQAAMNAEPLPPLPPRGTPCETLIPNLNANALPLTALLAAMVEYAAPVGLARMRLRDSWLGDGPSGPQVSFLLAIGGDHRPAQSANWERLRAHPLYLGEEEALPPVRRDLLRNHAVVTFMVPRACAKPAEFLVGYVPYTTDSANRKLIEAIASENGKPLEPRPPVVSGEVINRALRDLAGRVEQLRLTGLV